MTPRPSASSTRPLDEEADATLAPRCRQCGRRHLAHLKCWRGHYAIGITQHVLRTQGRVCWMARSADHERATTADHYLPRSRGGDDSDENLRPACPTCNSKRGNKLNPFPPDEPTKPAGALSSRWVYAGRHE